MSSESKIRKLKKHGKLDWTGWVNQYWFIDFLDELIEILIEMRDEQEKMKNE
jgi:hypothetical protein